MAKIEMDVSEYEAMKENKVLLEKSLEKERELKKEIDRLNEEKIDALEKSSMKVSKRVYNETREYVVDLDGSRDNMVMDITSRFHVPPDLAKGIANQLYKNIEVHKKESEPIETYTTHGLDEIKAELKEHIEKEIDEDLKNKAEKYDNVSRRLDETFDEMYALRENQQKVTEERDRNRNAQEERHKLDVKIDSIYSHISSGNVLRPWKTIREIKNIIND